MCACVFTCEEENACGFENIVTTFVQVHCLAEGEKKKKAGLYWAPVGHVIDAPVFPIFTAHVFVVNFFFFFTTRPSKQLN